ncbi:MAG: DUF2442 domain-containing protein [Kiritimatiellales bacterium]|nr:DUF2442 domain-containing protein [Kiritimatiellales bacterium]
MTLKTGIPVDVAEARWVDGYMLEIKFSDGISRKVDFENFLTGSVHPDIRKYLDVEVFKTFSISYGNLIWNDYDMCFSIEDLYAGTINAAGHAECLVAEEPVEYHASRDRE